MKNDLDEQKYLAYAGTVIGCMMSLFILVLFTAMVGGCVWIWKHALN